MAKKPYSNATRRHQDRKGRYKSNNYRNRFLQDHLLDYRRAPNMLCEGDSWFGYPSVDLLDYISRMGNYNMLRTEKAGDELIADIMTGGQRRRLERALNDYPFDVLLFSGGGNDILGDNLKQFIKKKDDVSRDPADAKSFITNEFTRMIDDLEQTYRDIYKLAKNGKKKNCPLVVHGYDFVYPSGRGFKVFGKTIAGPWIKPVMDHKDYKVPNIGTLRVDIVRELLLAFDRMLQELDKLKNFHHVRLLGTLTDAKGYWDNEIHPKPRGFRKLSKHYEPVLKMLLPGAFVRP